MKRAKAVGKVLGAVAMACKFHEPGWQRALTVAIQVVGKQWVLLFLPDPSNASTKEVVLRSITRIRNELQHRLPNIVPEEFPKKVAILFR